MSTLGQRVRKARVNCNLTQAELAGVCNTSQARIHGIENDTFVRGVPRHDVLSLAEALGVTEAYLSEGVGELPPSTNHTGVRPVSRNQLDRIEAKLDKLLAHFELL